MEHPILENVESEIVEFVFEGMTLKALKGDTIASALVKNGIDVFGYTEKGYPRGFFCAIGKCSSCLVKVNGVPNIRACITLVVDGMVVERQNGKGKLK